MDQTMLDSHLVEVRAHWDPVCPHRPQLYLRTIPGFLALMNLSLAPFLRPALLVAKSFARKALPLALLVATITAAQADPGAQTDRASITVTPLTRQASAPAAWQTIYDYSGGDVLPPGTRIIANGKWIEPVVRKDKSGVTFAFPDLPDQPQSAQYLNLGYAVDLPLANYPTRTTIHYTSFRASLLQLTPADDNETRLSSQIGEVPSIHNEAETPHAHALVLDYEKPGQMTATFDDQDVSSSFGFRGRPIADTMPVPGAMLVQGLALRGQFTQQPDDKGDWLTIHSWKIEQMRPPLESSAVAAVDLKVPGTRPIRVTIEVANEQNESQGYLLRDALVSPGTHRLYWDGINQKQSQPVNTTWIGAGTYTFHLTTGVTAVHYAGEINNSTPKYNRESYGMVNCTAVALTPPGTTLVPAWEWRGRDKRKLDTTDSVQLLSVFYDAKYGQWVGSDGTVLHTKTGANPIQHGRSLAITPPDPNDPTNPDKQFYFASRNNIITTCSLPSRSQKTTTKEFASPDWNRPPAGFVPFQVRIGLVPRMIGPQHDLTFEMQQLPTNDLHAEWVYRNVRLYEEGQPDPGPISFQPSFFTARIGKQQTKPNTIAPIPPGSVMIEDDGHTLHLKNSGSLNYPFEYTITPHTILAFDLNVLDKSNVGYSNGIGLDSQPFEKFVNREGHFFNFMSFVIPGVFGFYDPAIGAYNYPFYKPNTLYTDALTGPPLGVPFSVETGFLWQPGYYGVTISEDGKYLFACNNADHRLEVRDISTDGGLVAKIPVDYPMFSVLLPEGASGAPKGTRYLFLTTVTEGLLRITWNLADNSFGKPVSIIPASEFAYPRGIAYSAPANRLFVCDTFNVDRSKAANQIVVIDPQTGKILSRFGKKGGVDPNTGGDIRDDVFTCPLTIVADSKGALWINDYYSCGVRKYDFDATSNNLTLERRVFGPNTTNDSHFYWMPGDPPTKFWTLSEFLVRNESQIDADGRFSNVRPTSATYPTWTDLLRPYGHLTTIGDRKYGVFDCNVFEQVDGGWVPCFRFGESAGKAAREAGLLALPGESPTDLDKAIAASGDVDWEKRPWAWSDLNGDGRIQYSAAQPEFQIAFNSKIVFDGYIPPSGCLRSPDGAFVRTAKGGLVVIPRKTVNGHIVYTWDDAKIIPRDDPNAASDVLAQDGRYYALTSSTQRHDMGEKVISKISCYDETGKRLWARDQNDFSLICLQSLGKGMISVMDRGGWSTTGPVILRTSDGDQAGEVYCQESGDCWSNGALRSDPDTAYIGMVQAYKVTGLSTVKTATVTATLPQGGP